MVSTVKVNDEDTLADAMIAGMNDYVPAEEPWPEDSAPRADAPPNELRAAEDPVIGAAPAEPLGAEQVVLVNLEFVQEKVYLPDPDTLQFTGEAVQFHDGHLITDAATAARVLQSAPWVYQEPKTGPVFGPHSVTGFQTRSAAGWDRYNVLFSLNR